MKRLLAGAAALMVCSVSVAMADNVPQLTLSTAKPATAVSTVAPSTAAPMTANASYEPVTNYSGSLAAEVSSYYVNKNSSRVVDGTRAVDGDYDSAWNANSRWDGEWIRVYVPNGKTYEISGFAIANGYWHTSKTYKNNPRVRTADVYADDEYVTTVDLEDQNGVIQYIEFDAPVYANGIKLVIRDVYKGAKYKDLAITEITLF